MRTRFGVAFLVVAVALGGSLAGAGSAGAADSHAIAVSPSTGLTDGQTVTVTGSGFVETPGFMSWAVAQCDPAILTETISLENALHDCDATSTPATFADADAAGNLTPTPFVVRKSFTTSGNIAVTCGQSPNDCAILIAQITVGGGFVGAAAPISFGTPIKTVAQCYRAFAHDHQHGLRYRLVHLLTCVFTAIHHRAA